MLLLRIGCHVVRGEAHSQDSLCGVHCESGLLPLFFSSRSCMLSLGPMLAPSQCCGCSVGKHSYSILLVIISYSLCMCSDTLIFRILLFSQMYTLLQSLQGTWYTVYFSSGIFYFTLTRSCLRLEEAFTPGDAQAFSNLSLRPRT